MININTTHVEIVRVTEPMHTNINIFNFFPIQIQIVSLKAQYI